MEFGIFLQGYLPGARAHDVQAEHDQLMRECEYAIVADGHNWKYAWFGEHHALVEYSHMSAPEVMMGYVAARTERIHLGSGINSLSPRKEHPVRYAERVATLDHMTNRRFEWGTGRGAGSHEVASFNITDTGSTKAEWDEVIREIPRMWETYDYTHHGEHFTVPTPHNIVPKPFGPGHPPIWVACGNTPTFTKAANLGIGAIAFSFEPVPTLKPHVDAYKEAIAACTDPVGQYVNDNIMITSAVFCFEDRAKARRLAAERLGAYGVSMVNLYHDTMPKSPDAIVWPGTVSSIGDLIGTGDVDAVLDHLIERGHLLVGTPDEVATQLEKLTTVGFDQLVFGMPQDFFPDEVMEVLELFGDEVIPQFDTDPVHSTDRFRATAVPKHPAFDAPLPQFELPDRLPATHTLVP